LSISPTLIIIGHHLFKAEVKKSASIIDGGRHGKGCCTSTCGWGVVVVVMKSKLFEKRVPPLYVVEYGVCA
jgi:hypothetical protein